VQQKKLMSESNEIKRWRSQANDNNDYDRRLGLTAVADQPDYN